MPILDLTATTLLRAEVSKSGFINGELRKSTSLIVVPTLNPALSMPALIGLCVLAPVAIAAPRPAGTANQLGRFSFSCTA